MFHLKQNNYNLLHLYIHNLNTRYCIDFAREKRKVGYEMNNNFKHEIKQLGKMLGLDKNDINLVLNSTTNEPTSFSIGPSWYPGLRYGVISIKDF